MCVKDIDFASFYDCVSELFRQCCMFLFFMYMYMLY